ncbi:MAG: hypothetical protein ACRDXB_02605 [Actinomycetes bacterium]
MDVDGDYGHRLVRTPQGWRSRELDEERLESWSTPTRRLTRPRQWIHSNKEPTDERGTGMDDDGNWAKQLVLSLGVLVAISLVIGGIVSLVALGAADVAGVAGDADGSSSAQKSLYLPPTPTGPTTRPTSRRRSQRRGRPSRSLPRAGSS